MNKTELNEIAKELATLNLRVNKLFKEVTDNIMDEADKKATFMPVGETVQEFCKFNRCWAAMDKQGEWNHFYSKPLCHNGCWTGEDKVSARRLYLEFPVVDYDQSLVAPDGRLILIEGKKEKKPKEAKFKAGKWYKAKNNGVIYQCIAVDKAVGNMTLASVRYENGQLYPAILDKNNYYEMKHYNPDRKKKQKTDNHLIKRGEPIFVWNVLDPQEIPAIVRYFHSYSYCGVFTYINDKYGEKGTHYTSFRKFDPELVGIPRGDWPKEE